MAENLTDKEKKKEEENAENLNELLDELLQKKQKLFELSQKGGDQERNHLEITKELIDNENEILKLLNQKIESDKKLLGLSKEEVNERKKALNTLKEENDELEKKNNLNNNFANSLSDSFKSATGIGNESKSLLGKMIQLSANGGSLSEGLAAAGKNLSLIITPANLLAAAIDGIISQTKKLFFDMDVAFSEFEKTAGGVDAFKGRIEDLRSSNVQYGLSIADASKAFSDLKVNFAGFAGVSTETQNSLANTTAQMTKFGVSSSDTIKIQNMLVKGFQMTGQQSGDLQKQLLATAKSMGMPMQKVVSEFANASPALKAHGANMQKVFLDLQNQSKNVGIEFSKLQQITSKFDTFEGAADSAGQLNAILGGDYLNSLDLLNADEGERVRLMQEALQASNKSFDAMSKQERMAAAQALGLENATELQQLMNNTVQEGTVEALDKAKAEKELAQSVQDLTTLQEKLTAIMGQFAIVLTPVLDGLKEVATEIAQFIEQNPNLAKGLGIITFIILGLVVGLIVLSSVMAAFTTVMGGAAVAAPVAAGGMTVFSAGIAAVGASAAASALGLGVLVIVLLAAGASALMLGGGIALAAAGIGFMIMQVSQLIKSVTELFSTLSKSNPSNIAKSFSAIFDSITVTGLGKFAAFAAAADSVAESIGNINKNLTEMISKMVIVSGLNFITGSPTATANTPTATVPGTNIGTAATAAAATANTTNTINNTGQTNLVPVAIYIDSKKVGEILDPRVKQTIQDSLKKINSRMVPV